MFTLAVTLKNAWKHCTPCTSQVFDRGLVAIQMMQVMRGTLFVIFGLESKNSQNMLQEERCNKCALIYRSAYVSAVTYFFNG